MAFLEVAQIRDLHVEVTSRCNALCPQCSRVYRESLNPLLPLDELSYAQFQSFFPRQFCSQLQHVYFCGVHGDAAAAQSTLDILRYLRESGVRQLSLFSNGGLRNSDWWAELATILSQPKDRVHFSIDGLEDTNGLYRRHVNFSRVVENAKAFIGAGGKANWDYLVFSHNQHQVSEARDLARQMGFGDFRVKHSSRFVGDSATSANETTLELPVQEGFAERDRLRPRDQIAPIKERLEDYLNTTKINCKALGLSSIYISFDGRVWPCCWTASNFYQNEDTPKRRDLRTLLERYGDSFNSLHRWSLAEILAHPWFGRELENSWKCGFHDHPVSRLRACAQQCGQEYSAVASQLDAQTRAAKRL